MFDSFYATNSGDDDEIDVDDVDDDDNDDDGDDDAMKNVKWK